MHFLNTGNRMFIIGPGPKTKAADHKHVSAFAIPAAVDRGRDGAAANRGTLPTEVMVLAEKSLAFQSLFKGAGLEFTSSSARATS